MNKCKYCQAELAENGKFCPVCGKDNSIEEAVETTYAGPEIMEDKKASPAKIATAVVAIVVLAALLISMVAGGFAGKAPVETEPVEVTEEAVLGTIPADGNPDDETCKGTYTVTDEEVKANGATVVANIGEYQLTNAELQIYYWMEVQSFLNNYGAYASYIGLDYTQPLDTQLCMMSEDVSETWQQFFLGCALRSWQNYQSMAAEAEKNGFVLSAEDQEYLAGMEQSLIDDAAANGFENVEAMLAYNVGAGAQIADYLKFNEIYQIGFKYYQQLCDAIEFSDEELQAHYDNNPDEYTQNNITLEDKYVDVRHILIVPEGGTVSEDGYTMTYTEEEWAAAQQKAQEILDQYLAGDKTEDSFSALANEHTADGNDANYDGVPDGGLYTNVYKGQMVPEFEAWCFDETRAAGNTGLVKTTYGWHIMYFVDSRPVWKAYAESALMSQKTQELITQITEGYPMTVDYSAISLGFVDLNT